MEIKQINRESKGFFKAEDEGREAGVMTYSIAGPGKIIIDHTEVDPSFSGKGIGKQLVMAAVNYARANNIKIVPLCPFANKVFQRDETIRDVLF